MGIKKEFEFQFETAVAVDSGQLGIGDPGYWNKPELEYDNILEVGQNADANFDIENKYTTLASIWPTIYGDGMHSIYSVWNGKDIVGVFVSLESDNFATVLDDK